MKLKAAVIAIKFKSFIFCLIEDFGKSRRKSMYFLENIEKNCISDSLCFVLLALSLTQKVHES